MLFGLAKSVISEFKQERGPWPVSDWSAATSEERLQKRLLEKKKKDQIESAELEERDGGIKGELSEEISRQEEEASGKQTEGGFKRGRVKSEDDRAGRGGGASGQTSVSSPN